MSEFNRSWFDDRLEAFVDGELSGQDRTLMEEILHSDEVAASQLRVARLVKTSLSEMPWQACPSDITRAVLNTARTEAREKVQRRLVDTLRLTWISVFRPSLVVGVFIALIIIGTRIGKDQASPAAQEELAATPEEVKEALEQAKWTLAYLSELGRETGQSIRREVIEERVARPMHRAVSSAFKDDAPVQ